jgi:hypothetical protein
MVLEGFLFGEKNVSAFLPTWNKAWKSRAIENRMRPFQVVFYYREKGGG